jgi:ribosomal protein S18 acetylase RimI-like enzyme
VPYLRSRGVPFGWWVMPDDHPPELRVRLAAQGFVPEGEEPGMAIDLDQLGAAPERPVETVIDEITDVEGLSEHARLLATGFGMPPDIETAFRALLQGLPFGPGTSARYFLAHEHGQLVGTSLAVLPGRAAAIFNVVTTPEARGRGVGAAVTDAALRVARDAGYRIAVLESSLMGYNVYRRLGFEEYCKIGHYVWPGEADT